MCCEMNIKFYFVLFSFTIIEEQKIIMIENILFDSKLLLIEVVLQAFIEGLSCVRHDWVYLYLTLH